MAYFQVASEELTAAGALVVASDSDLTGGQSGLLGAAGAADETPAAGALESFIMSAGTAVSTAHTAVTELATSLREAATAYQMADSSAASSFTVGKG